MTVIPQDELVVLDTNVLVAYIRGKKLGEYIEKLYGLRSRTEIPIVCVVTVGEILALAAKFEWATHKTDLMKDLLAEFVHVDINSSEVLTVYAEISHYLYTLKPSVTIPQNDMWIAAVVKVCGAHLITTDTDFNWLKGVISVHWIDQTLAV